MIEILKETARYLVCVKPAGTAAQGTQAEAMPQLLSAQLGCGIFPVHRLDQTVGGVMVYAKTGRRKIRQPLWPLHLRALVVPAVLPGRERRSGF